MITYIFGEEDFLMERAAMEEVASYLGRNIVRCESKKFDPNDLLDEPSSYLVYDCESLFNISSDTIHDFLFLHKIGIKPPKNCNGRVLEYPKLKVNNSQNQVLNWVIKEGEKLNIDLSRVAGALFLNCGNRLRKISSEIEKIRTISSDGEVVSPDKVKSVLCFSSEITPRSILDAIHEGKTNLALSYYDRLQELGNETGWILSYLQNSIIQIYRAKIMKESGVKNISDVLEINDFVLNNFVLDKTNLWTQDSLKQSVRVLSDIEVYHKSGNLISDFMLELEIIRLSEEASIKLKSRS